MSNNNRVQPQNAARGFTLVEMLVSIAVFMSVMTVAAGALVSIIGQNRRAQEVKSVVDNITLAVDSISRNLRSGTNYACLDASGNLHAPECGGPGIMYQAPDGTYTKYQFLADPGAGNGNIRTATGCQSDGTGCAAWQDITAPVENVDIAAMQFSAYGDGATAQPRVFITAEGLVPGGANGTTTEFDIQTTASERARQ